MPKDSLKARVGKRIREVRKERKLSQEMLAFEADCDTSTIGRLERGELNATLDLIENISGALKIPALSLFDFDASPERAATAAHLKDKLTTVLRYSDRPSVEILSRLMDSLLTYEKGKHRR